MKITITEDKEKCIRDLFERFTHVVVQPQCLVRNPIRLREPMITDLPLYSHKPWLPNKENVLEEWHKKGGVLLNYSFNKSLENVGEHDAHIHVECPVDMQKFNNDTVYTQKEAVIYKPPSWKGHEDLLDIRHPHIDTIKRAWLVLEKMRKSEMPLRSQVACEVAKVPTVGIVACADHDLCRDAIIDPTRMIAVRKSIEDEAMQRKCKVVYALVPRIEPTDNAHREVWDKIKNTPESYLGERMFTAYGMQKLTLNWRKVIKAMVREGSIEKKYPIYIYPFGDIEPDWNGAESRRQAAFDELEKMKVFVEKNDHQATHS